MRYYAGDIMYNSIVVLGPTACGKTALAVRIAQAIGGEIISADSRQVYKGLDIGSGKDLNEFDLIMSDGQSFHVPYHLIDVVSLPKEYSVYDFQQDAYKSFSAIIEKKAIPVIVGGTGMYLDSLIRGYDLVKVPVNHQLRQELSGATMDELIQRLTIEKGQLHNSTDLTERHRLIRAIEIAVYSKNQAIKESDMPSRPEIKPLILGTTFPRDVLRKNIKLRLRSRLKEGMIEEVKKIHDSGIEWEQLERLGLEYRFVSEFLQGKILTQDELFTRLNIAIGQFAKRQETWFRGMERKGIKINWLAPGTVQQRLQQSMEIIGKTF